MGTTLFYARVAKCQHKDFTNHYAGGKCGTEYCDGWRESHCRDCGVFLIECPCGCENHMSGWPDRRRRTERRKAAIKKAG